MTNCAVKEKVTDLAGQTPSSSSEEIDTLVAMFNQGRYAEGETLARTMTMNYPQHGFGWKVLGALLKQQGRVAEALVSMQKAALLLPEDAEAYSNLGLTYQEEGRLSDAEASLRRAVAIRPDFAAAYYNLGITLQKAGRLSEAEASLRRTLEIEPKFSEAHNNLGITLQGESRVSEAETSYRRALEISPNYAEAHNNLGNVLREQGRLSEAEASYRRALKINPNYAEALNNLGVSLCDQGQLFQAEVCCRRALEIKPEYYKAHNNLGNALKEQGRLAEAENSFRRALEINLNCAEAYGNLGNTFKDQGRLPEAEASLRCALKIRSDLAEVHNDLGNILKDQGRLGEAEASLRRALEIKPDYAEARSNLLLVLNYADSHGALNHVGEARCYGRIVAGKTQAMYSSWRCAIRPERLRVGLVSGDLRNHPVGYFLESILAHLDPARIELFAYATYHKEDDLTARIRPRFAAWRSLLGLTDEMAASLIHADGVHVLLDLSGHTAHNRLPVFAWKPARVQASWLGYFATTGVAEVDYLLADETGILPEQRDQFTEAIWYLPDTRLCFTAPPTNLPVSPLPALAANGSVTFGSFQNLAKLGDGVLAAWAKILAALPDARLRLQCKPLGDHAVMEQLAQRLSLHGIDPARVSMHGQAVREAYLAAYAEVDLILDTFPYPGGTTTCEALWMGVPTLTFAGERLLSRQGASLLTAAGLAEWVATSEADYVAKAIALAGDVPKLAALRAGLRAQALESPLFDATRFARNFEAALWGMWQERSVGRN